MIIKIKVFGIADNMRLIEPDTEMLFSECWWYDYTLSSVQSKRKIRPEYYPHLTAGSKECWGRTRDPNCYKLLVRHKQTAAPGPPIFVGYRWSMATFELQWQSWVPATRLHGLYSLIFTKWPWRLCLPVLWQDYHRPIVLKYHEVHGWAAFGLTWKLASKAKSSGPQTYWIRIPGICAFNGLSWWFWCTSRGNP